MALTTVAKKDRFSEGARYRADQERRRMDSARAAANPNAQPIKGGIMGLDAERRKRLASMAQALAGATGAGIGPGAFGTSNQGLDAASRFLAEQGFDFSNATNDSFDQMASNIELRDDVRGYRQKQQETAGLSFEQLRQRNRARRFAGGFRGVGSASSGALTGFRDWASRNTNRSYRRF